MSRSPSQVEFTAGVKFTDPFVIFIVCCCFTVRIMLTHAHAGLACRMLPLITVQIEWVPGDTGACLISSRPLQSIFLQPDTRNI